MATRDGGAVDPQDGVARPAEDVLPLDKLAHDELLARMRRLTNLRVVDDPASTTGYSLEAGRFPGWETVPTW